MEHRRERGLKKLPDGRWQFSWCHGGHYYRRIAPSKTEARAYLEKIHTQIREGRYLDKKKEAKTTFEQAVEKFLEWSHANTRPNVATAATLRGIGQNSPRASNAAHSSMDLRSITAA